MGFFKRMGMVDTTMGFVCSPLINPPMCGFLRIKITKSRFFSSTSCWIPSPELSVCHAKLKGKDMLNQLDMTETAKAVLNALSDKPATAGEIAQNTHLTRERCQLILTQLVIAGLSDYQFGCYKRLQ